MCDIQKKLEEYLNERSLFVENKCWNIRNSPLGGRGIFANRNISPGEVIFVDSPVVIGPRSKGDVEGICVACFKIGDLNFCGNKCGLKICSDKCKNSEVHKRECNFINSRKNGIDLETNDISTCLTPIRALFLKNSLKQFFVYLKSHKDPKHEILIEYLKNKLKFSLSNEEETFLKLVCSVLDANAFEVLICSNQKQSTLRGLYPLASLANHDCSPNTTHVFDDQQRMITRATVFIPKDTEICKSYSRITWGTMTRRYHLFQTKHFACECPRCQDPTEFGTNLNAIKCEKCQSTVLPENSLELKSKWRCIGCKEITPIDRVSFISNILGSSIRMLEKNEDVEFIFKFLEKIKRLISDSNQVCVELKYKLVWILGYKQGYSYEDLPETLLEYKQEVCEELLELLRKLKAGACKIRGLLLYELYRCERERIRRKISGNEEKNDQLLKEAADILLYDTGAPEDVKKMWIESNVLGYNYF